MVDIANQNKLYKLKCWKCGGNHYLNKFPTRGSKKYGIYKVSKPMNKLESKEEEKIAEVSSPHVEMEGQIQQEQHEEVRWTWP